VHGGAVCGAMMDPVENGPTPQDLWRVREGQGGGAGHALASAMGHRSGLGGEEGSPREHSRSFPEAKKSVQKKGKCCRELVHERATKTAGRHWRERRIQEAGRTRPPARRQRSLKHLEGSILEGGREGKSEERGRPYQAKKEKENLLGRRSGEEGRRSRRPQTGWGGEGRARISSRDSRQEQRRTREPQYWGPETPQMQQ